VPILIAWALCLSLAGCASLNPHNWHWPTSHPKKAKESNDRIPPPEAPDVGAQRTSRPSGNGATTGILAGQVIDGFNQGKPGTIILVSASDAPNDPPQETSVNDQGYFVIQGLQPGKRYKLSARLKQGEQTLAGTTIATPPNVVLIIKLDADFATADVPAIRAGGGQSRAGNEKSWSPNAAPGYLYEPDKGKGDRTAPATATPQPGSDSNRTRLGTPESGNTPRPQVPFRPDLMATDESAQKKQPPAVRIPNKDVPGNNWTPGNAPPTSSNGSPGRGASCTLTADRVLDFTLTDLNGRPFALSDLRGKLVLIDFWGTWCPHCIRAMPNFIDLQRRYGSQGLEIIGIAYEDDKLTLQQKIDKVNFVAQRQGVNYKILLGAGDNCPVLAKLDVQKFPTLILVDDMGRIVWTGEGMSAQNQARLEAEIRKRLKDG
jgi:thiol-disulfide isomerase/thioredoxin